VNIEENQFKTHVRDARTISILEKKMGGKSGI
jgi:hypothetical protein